MSERQDGGGSRPKPGSSGVNEEEVLEVTIVEVEESEEKESSIREAEAAETQLERPVTVGELIDGASKALNTAGTTAKRLVDQGRHRKVRISRNGKAIMPDIPLAAFAAAEAASFASAGFARAIVGNVVGRFLFDVEIVNEADKYFKVGTERFLEGDFERAEQAFLKAVRIDDTHAAAYLQLGILYRMRGEDEQARAVLVRAAHLDDAGDVGRKAGDLLRALDGNS